VLILEEQKSPFNLRVPIKIVDLLIIHKKDSLSPLEFPKIVNNITMVSMYNYIPMLELMKIKKDEIEKEKFQMQSKYKDDQKFK
jgi:hypothetical protein